MAAAGAVGLTGCGSDGADDNSSGGTGTQALSQLPPPEESGIDHIVVLMMENRSFDHFMGWVPGANGVQAGLSFPDHNGEMVSTYHLAPNYQGCEFGDPAHGYTTGRTHLNGGKMDGWLQTSPTIDIEGDSFPVGYYKRSDLPFFSGVADEWTIGDNYFTGLLASTFPNRVYMHAGQTDRLNNTLPFVEGDPSELPTIWDRVLGAGLSAKYYFHDLPTIGLWGLKYVDIIGRYEQFLLDASLGNLPNLSFIDPAFIGEAPQGITNDDHPQADIRAGQSYMNAIYDALRSSPQWERTLLIINYDEWGGFYDHVVPPIAPVSQAEAELGNDGRLGFRVPLMLIGPRARRAHVTHHQFDPNSILNFICWRWGLEPLGVRHDSINIAHALDFDNAPRSDAPPFQVLDPITTGLCQAFPLPFVGDPLSIAQVEEAIRAATNGALQIPVPQLAALQHRLELLQVIDIARQNGFPI
ncbi:MAG: alkaline phosphatase family protein, partial [Nevskiales bacterium]